jgi:hypothetical protein
MTTAPAFDEGGNFIDVRFGPLSLRKILCPPLPASCLNGDYHLRPGSPALNAGTLSFPVLPIIVVPLTDFDGQPRPAPFLSRPDIGADEQ